MKVLINEKTYEYVSDYPHEWKFISKDHFKYPVSIGTNDCFIKRFQRRQQTITGWNLLTNLKNKNEINLPKVHDIVSVEENNRLVHYAFFEHKKGRTLDALLAGKPHVDLERLTNDLFRAFESLHKHQFWFTDFCEKNIFCEDSGKFLLIDVDSCAGVSVVPSNDMDVNMLYLAQVLKFYRDILLIELNPSDLPGIVLNHLQVIFLVLNLKIYLSGDQEHYTPDQTFNTLSSELDEIDPAFRELFKEVLKAAKDTNYLYDVDKIRKHVLQNIIVSGEQPIKTAQPKKQPQSADETTIDNESRTTVEQTSSDGKRPAEEPTIIREVPHNKQSNSIGAVSRHKEVTTAEKLDPLTDSPKHISKSSPGIRRPLVNMPAFWILSVATIAGVLIILWFNGAWNSSAGINIKKHEREIDEPGKKGDEQGHQPVNQKEKDVVQPEVDNGRPEAGTDQSKVQSNKESKSHASGEKKTEKTEINQPTDIAIAESTKVSGSIPQTCIAVCRTKGISGVEVSFSDTKLNKKYTLVSSGKDLEFIVPCDLLKETVAVSFKANGQPEYRNVKLKEFEIPEMFRNN